MHGEPQFVMGSGQGQSRPHGSIAGPALVGEELHRIKRFLAFEYLVDSPSDLSR